MNAEVSIRILPGMLSAIFSDPLPRFFLRECRRPESRDEFVLFTATDDRNRSSSFKCKYI